MNSKFVKESLKNYKPKALNLESYKGLDKLKNYKLLISIDSLVPNRTYIKYIKKNDFTGNNTDNIYVKSGGILLKGGYMKNGIFEGILDKTKWSHLMLKFCSNRPDIKENIFIIKMSNYYIFYKKYGFDMIMYLKKLGIE